MTESLFSRPNCRLQVFDRFISDPRTRDCPAQLHYIWEGMTKIGQQLVFTQVYYPHLPYRARASSNNPNSGLKTMYADDLQATAGARAITVLRDDVEASVLSLEFKSGQFEYVVFNPSRKRLNIDSIETRQAYLYKKME